MQKGRVYRAAKPRNLSGDMRWNLGLPMRWKGVISDYSVVIHPSKAMGPTTAAVYDALTGRMSWEDDVSLIVGNYNLLIEAFPFASGPGLELDFRLTPVFPSIGFSTIKTRWEPGMHDIGLPFLTTSLTQLAESHAAPLASTLFYNLHPCIYVDEPP